MKLGDDGDLVPLAVDVLAFAWLIACGVEPILVRDDGAFDGPPTPSEALQAWVRLQDPERDFGAPSEVIAEARQALPTFAESVQAQVLA
ncbi:MAG: hypothetical protein U0325_04315 [Polyangiales bacterium]